MRKRDRADAVRVTTAIGRLQDGRIGEGLVGYAALHKCPSSSTTCRRTRDTSRWSRTPDSELVVPLLAKDRCVACSTSEPGAGGVHEGAPRVLTRSRRARRGDRQRAPVRGAAAQQERLAKNGVRADDSRALQPTELPKRVRGLDVAMRLEPARELGGDFYDFLALEPHTLTVAVGDVSARACPRHSTAPSRPSWCDRAPPRRYTKVRTAGGHLESMNTILHERQLESYYCTLCYAHFDFKRRIVTMANSGLPFPSRLRGRVRNRYTRLACPSARCPASPTTI